MVYCRLCVEVADEFLDLKSDEAREANASHIVHKYFSICFEEEPKEGLICRKCWCQLELFHSFYTRIESIHLPSGSEVVFAEALVSVKAEDEVDEENLTELLASGLQGYEPFEDDESTSALSEEPAATATARKAVKRNVSRTPKRKEKLSKNKCPGCDQHYAIKKALYKHMEEEHSLLACNSIKCGQFFRTLAEFEEHRINEHKIPRCPVCKKLANSQNLNSHLWSEHKDMKDVTCDKCGQKFNKLYLFKAHYKQKHEVTELCTCDFCGAVANNKTEIRMHLFKYHVTRDVGPKACEVCGKVFRYLDTLKTHEKIHSTPSLMCDTCGKGFHRPTALQEHMTIHTGKKDRYKCVCGKSYRFNASYYVHRKACNIFQSQ